MGSPRFLGTPSICALWSSTPVFVHVPLPLGSWTAAFRPGWFPPPVPNSASAQAISQFRGSIHGSQTRFSKLYGSVTLHRIGSLLPCRQAFGRWVRFSTYPQGYFDDFQLSHPAVPGFSWRHQGSTFFEDFHSSGIKNFPSFTIRSGRPIRRCRFERSVTSSSAAVSPRLSPRRLLTRSEKTKRKSPRPPKTSARAPAPCPMLSP